MRNIRSAYFWKIKSKVWKMQKKQEEYNRKHIMCMIKDEKAKASPSPSPVKRKITNTKEIVSGNGGETSAATAASCPEDFLDHFNKDEDDLLQLAMGVSGDGYGEGENKAQKMQWASVLYEGGDVKYFFGFTALNVSYITFQHR